MFFVLCSLYYVLYIMFFILYSLYYVLYIIFFIYYVLYTEVELPLWILIFKLNNVILDEKHSIKCYENKCV